MPKSKPQDGTAAVNDYMKKLVHPQKDVIEAVRSIFMKANKKVAERVKWNAPSFHYKDDIAAFNPRAKGFVQLVFVFHRGKMIEDRRDLLEGDYEDRRLARFIDLRDVAKKKKALQSVIDEWIRATDDELGD